MTIRERAYEGRPLECPIIDAHTHLGGYYHGGWFHPDEVADTGKTLAIARRMGTDCIVTAPHSLIYGDMEMANRSAAEAAAQFPGVIYGYISVCPGQGLAEVKRQLDRYSNHSSFVGLKFLGGYHGSYRQREYQYALDFAEEMECPVLCHVFGGDPPLEEFVEILKKRRRLSMLAAHLGGGYKRDSLRYAEMTREYENLYLETCGQVYNEASDEDMVEWVGAERLIFGTDLINVNPYFDFGRLAFAEISDTDKKKIFAENYLRLLRRSHMGKIRLPEA